MAQYIDFKPGDYYNTTLYTGDGVAIGSGGQAITGVGFQSDMTWIKCRSDPLGHQFFSSPQGVTKMVWPDDAGAQATRAESLTAWGADGFTLGSDGDVNYNTNTFASFNWYCGTTSGLTGGTITPTAYSINTTACQEVYTYTGTGANATIAHGLGKVPTLILVKCTSNSGSWAVYQGNIGYNSGATTAAGELDMTLDDSNARTPSSDMWNDTDATDTVFTVGTNAQTNTNTYTYVAYVFCDVPGYCQTGAYKGNNNSDGPFQYLGFRPSWLMIKNRDSGGPTSYGWAMMTDQYGMNGPAVDGSLEFGGNYITGIFYADQTAMIQSHVGFDLLSNGFKIRQSGVTQNSTGFYQYTAFAAQPLVGKNQTPGVAR